MLTNMILNPSDYQGILNKNDNDFDYLEIGTCDWDVFSMTKPTLKGLIVEPIKFYLDRIPNNNNAIKANYAISDENKKGYMYYIPSDVIEKKNIVNCFRGMNKLDEPHMGAISNNFVHLLHTEECEVITYFELLKKFNVSYVDFLKIDTEGNDCRILNNLLDDLNNYPDYILPRYLLFENNGLTDKQIRIDTEYRLTKFGYVHIFTENDNTFMYNCSSYHNVFKKKNNVLLPQNNILYHTNKKHFFHNVHSYIEYGQKNLFSKNLNFEVLDDYNNCDILWTTQQLSDYHKYKNNNNNVVNIVHGGGTPPLLNLLINIEKPNIIVKSIEDYKLIKNHDTNKNANVGLFIGKYECLYNYITKIYEYRMSTLDFNNNNFLMLNGFFLCNNKSILDTYEVIKKKYNIDMYGYQSSLGWAEVYNSKVNISDNVLSKYKFMLHLKGLGYLCNSVIFACMAGMPIIMSRENYIKTLYHQYIPEDLIIFFDNYDCQKTNPEEISIILDDVINNISPEKYFELSKKLYIHGTYFRTYFDFEIKHLKYFLNNIQ